MFCKMVWSLLMVLGSRAILKALTHHGPDLHELSLFPDPEFGHYQSEREHNLFTFVSGNPFYHYLVGANSLRHLSGAMAWLQREPLLVLGKLPLLENITHVTSLDLDYNTNVFFFSNRCEMIYAFGNPRREVGEKTILRLPGLAFTSISVSSWNKMVRNMAKRLLILGIEPRGTMLATKPYLTVKVVCCATPVAPRWVVVGAKLLFTATLGSSVPPPTPNTKPRTF
ncbi:hypothetical protein BDV93DRAFT_511261 [Ceratobasidium sp. AG-I]|nr:hypothetical protein BDV93DRAFT_511261 [Ceratobasidium sp. AG-I]